MKKIRLGNSDLEVGEISLGCMRMHNLTPREAQFVVENALEAGVDLFDHADIYGNGTSEEVFAGALDRSANLREKMIIQTKCGIREGYFDFSEEHIFASVDGSLARLKVDTIDILLLHRPDALVEPEVVAEAFTTLKKSGKVRYFGVSNQNPMQIELLKKYLQEDLLVNQLQYSLMHTPMLDAGFNVNMQQNPAIVRDSNVLEYSRLNNMTIQAWSPFQHGMIQGVFVGNERFAGVNTKLQELAEKKGVTDSAIAIAWILRHPAKIQPVVGTMNPQRLTNIAQACDIELSRKEWYELYLAAGNELP